MAPAATESLLHLLVDQGFVSRSQLDEAVRDAEANGLSLRQVLTKSGWVDSSIYVTLLSFVSHLPIVDLGCVPVDQEALRLVPASLARGYRLIPFRVDDTRLLVAAEEPLEKEALDQLASATGKHIRQYLCHEGQAATLIAQHYAPVRVAPP